MYRRKLLKDFPNRTVELKWVNDGKSTSLLLCFVDEPNVPVLISYIKASHQACKRRVSAAVCFTDSEVAAAV